MMLPLKRCTRSRIHRSCIEIVKIFLRSISVREVRVELVAVPRDKKLGFWMGVKGHVMREQME